jgi:ribonuclease-3
VGSLRDSLEQCLEYRFQDEQLLERALTHRSVSKNINNERLEFLGDAQLSQVISHWLFDRFPAASEGQLTRMRASLVRGQTLAELAREKKLGDHLRLGSGELKSGGFRRDSILADALEAIIGAILLDAGVETCREVLLCWFADRLERISPQTIQKDAKTRLQEWLQAHQFSLPDYTLQDVSGQPPKQVFYIDCFLQHQKQHFAGEGSSRRRAEQQAASQALAWLEKSV